MLPSMTDEPQAGAEKTLHATPGQDVAQAQTPDSVLDIDAQHTTNQCSSDSIAPFTKANVAAHSSSPPSPTTLGYHNTAFTRLDSSSSVTSDTPSQVDDDRYSLVSADSSNEVEGWDETDVAMWLQSFDEFASLSPIFVSNGINGMS